jgi:hypothetical protein
MVTIDTDSRVAWVQGQLATPELAKAACWPFAEVPCGARRRSGGFAGTHSVFPGGRPPQDPGAGAIT